MTSNGRYAVKGASFGAHHKNWNEDRPHYQQQKCRPVEMYDSSLWLYKTYADIHVPGFSGEGASNDSGVA